MTPPAATLAVALAVALACGRAHMEAALRWLAEATPGRAELLRLTREPSYLAGRLSALDARLEGAHMGCSIQTKAWASDADQGIGQ